MTHEKADAVRLRAAYVTDTMADVRNLEGLTQHMDVTLVAPSALGARVTNYWPPKPPAQVERVLLPGGRLAFGARTAIWLWRNRRRFDVAYVLDNTTIALAANLAFVVGGPPTVLQVLRPTVEYVECQRGRRPLPLHLARLALAKVLVAFNERTAAAIGAVSEYCAEQCRRRNHNVRFVPTYGVDVERFAPRWTKVEARGLLGLPDDAPLVMWRSRMAPEKDPVTFLRAIAGLRSEGRAVHAVYMGGEFREFESVAGVEGVDVIARAPTDLEEIPVWYVAADVDVQTSHAEGLGLSPLEALACGTPIVVSGVGGLVEVADHGRVGKVVPARDPVALADAISSYLGDPEGSTADAAAGREWVAERFGAEAALRAWAELGASVARARPQRLRVLFVDHETRLSGGQRDLVDLVRALRELRDLDLHAALPAEGPLADALRANGVTLHFVTMRESMRKVSRWQLAEHPVTAVRAASAVGSSMLALDRLVARLQPAIVHSNSLKAHVLVAPAARRRAIPHVWHVRDILEQGWLQRATSAFASVSAARVVCISGAVTAPFDQSRVSRRVRVVSNGVRPGPVDDDEVASWRTKLGASRDGDVLVGIVGQIARWKGQDVFVDAAAMAATQCPKVRFAVVGACLFPENEAEFDAGIRRAATSKGLDDRLVWAGSVDPIEPVMGALDVLVHASRLPEPFGRVIVEAMAQGTPVISTTIGAGPELVPADAGVLVPPGNAAALADAIVRLVDDPAQRRSMGDRARSVAASYDIAATGRGVLAIYDEVMSATNAS